MADKTTAQRARDAAMLEAVTTIVYIAVSVGVSLAVLKRDAVTRLWRRVTTRRPNPATVRERAAVADFRRELSELEHQGGPAPRPRGLYEGR